MGGVVLSMPTILLTAWGKSEADAISDAQLSSFKSASLRRKCPKILRHHCSFPELWRS